MRTTSGTTDAWQGVLTYALQLYFDFSGYSDMAVGLARIFSIRFPFNFNSPFKSTSVIEFWQRWHMTLTQYIMSYVYTPIHLVISRRRRAQGKKTGVAARNTIDGFLNTVFVPTATTMFLAGVWHGAGLQFFGFGISHGIYLTVNHLWRTFVPMGSLPRRIFSGPVAVALTMLCVMLAMVQFRADGLGDAFAVYAGMLGLHGPGAPLRVTSVVKFAGLVRRGVVHAEYSGDSWRAGQPGRIVHFAGEGSGFQANIPVVECGDGYVLAGDRVFVFVDYVPLLPVLASGDRPESKKA